MSTKNYAAGQPVGNNNVPLYDCPPPFKAIATTTRDTTATASSILNLTQNTTAVEVAVAGGPVYIRWMSQTLVDSSVAATSVIATGASANYDHVVPNQTVRRFVVPIEGHFSEGYGSLVGARVANALFPSMGMIGGTGASVIAITQYGSSNSY